jgi:hypothetical protein
MIPIDKFLEAIKKHGSIGVLAFWLTYTHFEVQELKERLYNCLERREFLDRNERESAPEKRDTLAILTDNKKRRLL